MPSTANRATSAAPITRLRVTFISLPLHAKRNALDERFAAPVYSVGAGCAETPEAFSQWRACRTGGSIARQFVYECRGPRNSRRRHDSSVAQARGAAPAPSRARAAGRDARHELSD